jgi:hypothetical protein
MKCKFLNVVFAGIVLSVSCLVNLANAGLIHYSVERSVGEYGKVTGTITTDETLGVITQSNIIDWNLVLNADSNVDTFGLLFGPLSGNNSTITFFPTSAIWSASTNAVNSLVIDFGFGNDNVFQITTGDYGTVWQMQPGNPFKDELIRESHQIQEFKYHGDVTHVIGTSNSIAVPEPSTLVIFALGVIGLVSRRFKNRIQ